MLDPTSLLISIRSNKTGISRVLARAQGWSIHREAALLTGLFALAIMMLSGRARADDGRKTLVYDIIREGSTIGTTRITIDRHGEAIDVATATNVRVKIAFVEVYHYELVANESWRDGALSSFQSRTNDNGTRHTVSIAPAGAGRAKIQADGHADEAAAAIPGTLWRRFDPNGAVLVDPMNGKKLQARAIDLGEESIVVHGDSIKARHVQLRGEMPRDLWFTGDTMVRMQLRGSDGSLVTSDLRR